MPLMLFFQADGNQGVRACDCPSHRSRKLDRSSDTQAPTSDPSTCNSSDLCPRPRSQSDTIPSACADRVDLVKPQLVHQGRAVHRHSATCDQQLIHRPRQASMRETLGIAFESCGTCGYQWVQLDSTPAFLIPVLPTPERPNPPYRSTLFASPVCKCCT